MSGPGHSFACASVCGTVCEVKLPSIYGERAEGPVSQT
jgi:hypothetical protein